MERQFQMELRESQDASNIQKFETENVTRIQIGKYMLEYPQDHPKKKPINKEVMRELKDEDKDILDLSWGKYKRFKWNKVFRHIKETFIQRVSACGNTDAKILIELSRVTFHNLTYLDLRDCQLANIEALPSGPNLNYLSLANNNIYTASSLNKCELSGLRTLLLNENPISILGLERCNFELEIFWLERKYDTKTIKQSLCQTAIFKLKSEQMKDISIQSQKRIYQSGPIKQMHEKYLHLERLLYGFVDDQQIQFINYLSDDSEEGIMPLQEQDEVEPPPLYNVDGEDEEQWGQEQENACYDLQSSQSSLWQFQQTKSMSDESWSSQ